MTDTVNNEQYEKLMTDLRRVMDPELGMNVVELGMIRDVVIEDEDTKITMILTTPFCPYAPAMINQVRITAEESLGTPATVEMGMEMWDPSMMEEGAGADWGSLLNPNREIEGQEMRDCNSVFAQIISTREEQMDVARAALLFACEAYPNLDIASYLGALDDMAATLRPQLTHEHPAIALGRFLSNDKGFHGNTDDFFDPRNSYLNQVLDRRTGIPISLSVIYLEVAQRLNLPIVGIALPGHFVIRYDGDEEPLYLDPFNGGATLSTEDCRQRVADISDGRLPFRQSFLYPVGPRQILTRMLRNLKGIYVARTDFESAIPVIEKLILLNPSNVEEIRDLGMLYYYAGQQSRAIGCLEKYLSLAPDAKDREAVQSQPWDHN